MILYLYAILSCSSRWQARDRTLWEHLQCHSIVRGVLRDWISWPLSHLLIVAAGLLRPSACFIMLYYTPVPLIMSIVPVSQCHDFTHDLSCKAVRYVLCLCQEERDMVFVGPNGLYRLPIGYLDDICRDIYLIVHGQEEWHGKARQNSALSRFGVLGVGSTGSPHESITGGGCCPYLYASFCRS